jgi:hypothetical protein
MNNRLHFGSLEAIERGKGHQAQLFDKVVQSNGNDLMEIEDMSASIPVHDQEEALKEMERKVLIF